MGYEHQMPFHCIADGDFPALLVRVIGVRKGHRECIEEHRGRIFKGYACLVKLAAALRASHSKVTLAVYLMASSIADSRRDSHSLYIGDRKNLSSAFHNGEEMIEAGHASNGYHPPICMK